MIAVYVTRNFDLAHIGDKPYVCTGCDKDFIYELYKSEMILGNNELQKTFHAHLTIISAYLVLYILGNMYIDLAHTGDEPCECTGCDKGFKNEQYKFYILFSFQYFCLQIL